MKKSIFFSFALFFAAHSLLSQTYHSDDKEGLRVFLRQASAINGEINAEQIGLTLSDTSTWYADENWITKIPTSFLIWNNDNPKRLDTIRFRYPAKVAGVLDGRKWSKVSCLTCGNNQLTSVNVSGCLNLIFLECSYNQLTSLNVSNCPKLESLSCAHNQLTSLDIDNSPHLESLYCNNNQLTHLVNVSNFPNLIDLRCNDNLLTSLSLNNCLNLRGLSFHNNQLQGILDVSNRLKLTSLSCHNNQLTSVNVSGCPKLYTLYCNDNLLTSLNVSGCSYLWRVNCQNNQIQSLDLSDSPDLDNFDCSNNRLQHLDISTCTDLYEYRCFNNQLSLSELYNASWKISDMGKKSLGTQNLAPKRVLVEDSLFKDESVFIVVSNGNIIHTEYIVTQNESLAPDSSYSVNDGILVFHDTGVYTITMTNIAVVSSYAYPAQVIVELHVVEAYNTDACLSDITVSAGTLSPTFNCTVSDYTVDVANNVDTINITATPNDIYATINGDIGLQQLLVGENYFTITVTAEDGIATQQYTIMINRSSVDIVEIHPASSLKIYPNPTIGELTVESGQLTIDNIEIIDITGKLIKTYSAINSTINVSELFSGMYFIIFYCEGQKITRRFVKKQ